jgi:hypothetical protein
MQDWRDIDKRERRKEYLTMVVMCVIFVAVGKLLFGMF